MGAFSAGISQDSLARWEKEDAAFADHLKLLKANFMLKKLKHVKNEWVLERLFREEFTEKSEVSITNRSKADYIEFVPLDENQINK